MTAYTWRDSSVRDVAHAFEVEALRVVDDVSACGTGGLAASLDGEARQARCFWCQRIAARGQVVPGTGEARERQRRREAEARRYRRQKGGVG